jgi:hypothetical protein
MQELGIAGVMERIMSLVCEAQYSGPEYWHFSNVIRANECVLGFGTSNQSLSYAVQVRENALYVYDRQGNILFSGEM